MPILSHSHCTLKPVPYKYLLHRQIEDLNKKVEDRDADISQVTEKMNNRVNELLQRYLSLLTKCKQHVLLL